MTQPKPKLRREPSIDFHYRIVQAAYQAVETSPISAFPFQNCLSCSHFTENTMFCKRWDARPPAKTIIYGCDEYDDLYDVPF